MRFDAKTFPVDIQYLPADNTGDISVLAANAARKIINQYEGDILIFLPGIREIRRVQYLLEDIREILIIPLYGNLPKNLQDAALNPPADSKRRIILSTSLAETSVTVPNIKIVIDSGWMRQPSVGPAPAAGP